MKIRKHNQQVSEAEEREAADEVRRLVSEQTNVEPHVPSPSYFASLLVKTNETIDHVTSGKALSISWLARVAVPGVVAILFFSIGLHYYRPNLPESERHVIGDAVKALPQESLDSLLAGSTEEVVILAAHISENLFEVTNENLAEFYLSTGGSDGVLESLPEQQLGEVAVLLESRSINL